MIVLALEALRTRTGVAALTALVGALIVGLVVIHYEGVPIGPLRYIPGIHYVFPEGKIERVKREAVTDLVKQSELDAANAKLAKAERDLASANIASARYATLYQEAQARNAAQVEADAKEDAEYVKRLREAGRSCDLSDPDLDYIYGVRK